MPHRKENQITRTRGKLSTNKATIQQLVGNLLQSSSKWSFSSKKEEWENYVHLHELIQQIIKHQTEGQLSHHRGSDKDGARLAERCEHARALHTWVLENGGRVVGVECCQTEHGLGMQCCQTLQCGQTALEIPRRIMFTLDSARHTVLGELLYKDRVAAAVPQVRLALHLLEQWLNLERDGRWRSYLLSLPLEYDTVLYFTPEELRNLSGSRCLEAQ